MPRQSRVDIADEVYHVINRANARSGIFRTNGDYAAVLQSLEETLDDVLIDLYSFEIMPNHWHFGVKPNHNGDLGRFFGKFTQKVTQRWHAFHGSAGTGHLFQGRFKSFIVQKDSYFLQLMKYIESNPLRAGLVDRAEEWKWGSLHLRTYKPQLAEKLLALWPIDRPVDYLSYVNQPASDKALKEIRNATIRGKPLGEPLWVQSKVEIYHLDHTVRRRGRPNKAE